MRPLPNFNFDNISTFSIALTEIENHIRLLGDIIMECDDQLTDADRVQLIANIQWLKRFYEAAERCLLNDN